MRKVNLFRTRADSICVTRTLMQGRNLFWDYGDITAWMLAYPRRIFYGGCGDKKWEYAWLVHH